MKRVSFEVAKAIKDAGYPQENLTDKVYLLNCDKEGKLAHYNSALYYDCAVAPTYLEVWLWLWREKKIAIPADYFGYENNYWESCVPIDNDKFEFFSHMKDPEEAIIAAIEYLVTNKLLK